MTLDPAALPAAVLAFLVERHLATLTTLRADGTPHVVPVGFTFDPDRRLARVITRGGSRKVAHVRAAGPAGARVALSQVDGGRWLTLEGAATVSEDPTEIAEAVQRYAGRYRPPAASPTRVALLVAVDRVLGRVPA